MAYEAGNNLPLTRPPLNPHPFPPSDSERELKPMVKSILLFQTLKKERHELKISAASSVLRLFGPVRCS
jgi:hypothetical protein